jgi:hypothetical protein
MEVPAVILPQTLSGQFSLAKHSTSLITKLQSKRKRIIDRYRKLPVKPSDVDMKDGSKSAGMVSTKQK